MICVIIGHLNNRFCFLLAYLFTYAKLDVSSSVDDAAVFACAEVEIPL